MPFRRFADRASRPPAAAAPLAAVAAEARRAPMLDASEEGVLARRVGAGDADASRRLIASHLRLVIKIARRYRSFGLPMSDLVQEGVIGLIHAVRRYDPDRGVRLSTYAVWWVRAAIQEYVVRSWSVVRLGTTSTHRSLVLRLRKLASGLIDGAEEIGDDVARQLAQRFDTTTAEVVALARRLTRRDQSLDQPAAEGVPLAATLACPLPTPEDAVATKRDTLRLVETVQGLLAKLPAREALIIRRRYLDEARATFAAIGREIGLSKDRVRQLEAQALERLRDLLQSGGERTLSAIGLAR